MTIFPLLAKAEYIDAICIGLTNISPWPYPESANFFSFISAFPELEYCDFLNVNGNLINSSIFSLKPNLSKFEQKVSVPICIAAWPKNILSECINAFDIFFAPLYAVNVVI